MGAELDLKSQISFVESILMYDEESGNVGNPFVNLSCQALLVGIRKSLLELQEFKSAKLAKGQT